MFIFLALNPTITERRTHIRNKDISIFEKTVFNGSICGIHTKLTEMYFNDVFWIRLKLWVGMKITVIEASLGKIFFRED